MRDIQCLSVQRCRGNVCCVTFLSTGTGRWRSRGLAMCVLLNIMVPLPPGELGVKTFFPMNIRYKRGVSKPCLVGTQKLSVCSEAVLCKRIYEMKVIWHYNIWYWQISLNTYPLKHTKYPNSLSMCVCVYSTVLFGKLTHVTHGFSHLVLFWKAFKILTVTATSLD